MDASDPSATDVLAIALLVFFLSLIVVVGALMLLPALY
jgi:hypothetical protein